MEALPIGKARRVAFAILRAAGLGEEPATTVAHGLVEADLYGHSTHGLALLPAYVDEIERGSMTRDGGPAVLKDGDAVALWDARRLPGIWTTQLAVAAASEKAARVGCGVVVLRNSHHIACLATFLEQPARDGRVVLVLSSDPAARHVAPFGGTSPVFSPDPIAAGLPTSSDPILVDVSTSITTAAQVERARAAGRGVPGRWIVDEDGEATDDPAAIARGGALLPMGGTDHGHKGYGLAILVEMLTQGLAGHGRADRPTGWGATVTVLVLDPAAFGGIAAFERQADWLVDACRTATVPTGRPPVRLPGEAALRRKAAAEAEGLHLDDRIMSGLAALIARFEIQNLLVDA